MLRWFTMRRLGAIQAPVQDEPPRIQRPAMSGKYLSLFRYLDGRFADRVVLTFNEIEDILGFALPDPARKSADWWTAPDTSAASPRCSDSWILANRTARPNLLAHNVVFDRAS